MVIPILSPTQHEDTVVSEADPVGVVVDVEIILQLSVWQQVVVTPAIVPAEQVAEHDWTTTDVPDTVADVVYSDG